MAGNSDFGVSVFEISMCEVESEAWSVGTNAASKFGLRGEFQSFFRVDPENKVFTWPPGFYNYTKELVLNYMIVIPTIYTIT